MNGLIGNNMKKIIYKIPGGKLVKIQVEIENFRIKKIKINGDFFVHPEEAIVEIENFLVGKEINSVEKSLGKFLKEKKIEIIGFEPLDVEKILLNNSR
jgi:hypothetical protein